MQKPGVWDPTRENPWTQLSEENGFDVCVKQIGNNVRGSDLVGTCLQCSMCKTVDNQAPKTKGAIKCAVSCEIRCSGEQWKQKDRLQPQLASCVILFSEHRGWSCRPRSALVHLMIAHRFQNLLIVILRNFHKDTSIIPPFTASNVFALHRFMF